MKLTLLMTPNCKLCDDAKLNLKPAIESFNNISYDEVDISSDDGLLEKYMIRVPVILHEDTIIQEGITDFYTIYEYIESVQA